MKKRKFDILAIITFFVLSILFVMKMIQNDTFYYIKIGEDILKYGVDMIDHYSIHNLKYLYPHWLYDVCIYLVYNFKGFFGLYVMNILICSLGAYIVYKFYEDDKFFGLIFGILFIILLGVNITARSQSISYIIFLLEIINIEKFIKTGRNKYLVFLFMLLLLLFNTHMAMYPVFYVIFIPYFAEHLISLTKLNKNKEFKFSNYEIEKNKNIKKLFIFMILSIFTAMLTPIGMKNTLEYIFYNKGGEMIKYIKEHRALTLLETPQFCSVLFATLVSSLFLNIRFKLRDVFMLLGFLLLSFMGERNISLFYIIWVLLFGRTIVNYVKKYDNKTIENITKLILKYSICYLLIIFVVLINFLKNNDSKYLSTKMYPIKATEYIKKNLDYKNIRIFNEYNFGSYLLFNDIKVFIDSRADLYEKNFNHSKRSIVEDAMDINRKNYNEILEYYDITHILLYNTNFICDYLKKDENYKIIYKDERYLLFERKV